MKIGLYTHDLYRDGQVGMGTSKYVFYLLRELEQLGVDIVRLEKGARVRLECLDPGPGRPLSQRISLLVGTVWAKVSSEIGRAHV